MELGKPALVLAALLLIVAAGVFLFFATIPPSLEEQFASVDLDQAARDNMSLPLVTIGPASSRIVRETAHSTGKWVALTFDDGPNPPYTAAILAILKQYNVHATFCIVGEQAQKFPALVQQVVADGHRLCDHTMTHDQQLPYKSDARIKLEVLGDLHVLQTIVPNEPVIWYRPPGGALSQHLCNLVAGWGLQPLTWSIDTRDWSKPGVQAIVDAVEKNVKSGDVILMHDGGGDRSETIAALQILIPWLIAQGYQFDFPAAR